MGKTNIEWTDRSWNPLRGCSKVSPGCKNCYAERDAWNRMRDTHYKNVVDNGRWNGNIEFVEHKLREPLRWTKPSMVFVNSMSDLFHEEVKDDWIEKIFAVMAMAPNHTFQILTKRPERMREFLSDPKESADRIGWAEHAVTAQTPFMRLAPGGYQGPTHRTMPLDNVWLGVSIENQETAEQRIPCLLDCPAAIRFVSYEPALGAVDLQWCDWCGAFGAWHNCYDPDDAVIDWVIAGAESGPEARPAHPSWFREIRDQCQAAGVPFFMKQLCIEGKKVPYENWAPDLQIREFPQ